MYHRVAEETFDPWGLAVSHSHFADQLRWLSTNRTVVPLHEFAARHARGDLPRDAIAVTFDDGYSCTVAAARMLEAARLPATIFIPATLIERGRPFWWDELQTIVLSHGGDSLELDGRQVALGPKQQADESWQTQAPPKTPRQAAFQHLWAALRERPPAELDSAMADLRGQSTAPAERDQVRPMTPDQVRAIASDLITFGSHALTHPLLTSLDRATKAREIEGSIDRCEALSGSRPLAFAYPYGNFDSESEELARRAGFAFACATGGSAVTTRSRQFALPRVQVGNCNAGQLAKLLATAA
jgi:peptidoglycan/xylan/chitin deacetylase (PgdA/CDA1 family)